jgi:hypothetical protein
MRIALFAILASGLIGSTLLAVPVPSESKKGTISRADFVPYRKHLPIPGKIVAVLLTDGQPILTTEGRSGPPDQLCIGYNAGSYRWVYVPVAENATIQNLRIALPEGKTQVFPKLAMASPANVKQWGVTASYSLVEVEVNNGMGSPAEDAFVATNMKVLDGSKDFPIKVADTIAQLKGEYEKHLTEKAKDLDAAMEDAAKLALKNKKPTGPRVKNTLMFVTWMAETEQLHVRFLTKITDGAYQYANGIKIEFAPPPLPPAPPKGGIAPPPRLPNGLKYGTEFGIEYGVSYEVSKSGKVERTKTMDIKTFTNDLKQPMLGPLKK